MLEIKNLTIKMGDRCLVDNLSFSLSNKDKMAVIGEEGNGKSTLLKAILGKCDYALVEGSIKVVGKIGYLEQSLDSTYGLTRVYDYLFIDDNSYYEKVSDLYHLLEIFHLQECILEQEIGFLSGGEKVKINLLKMLLDESDILLLDEPTNDLDIETLEWLEDFINKTNKPILYVSHDEVLLSKTATMILHLEQINKKTKSRCTLLKTDYDSYIEQRLRSLDKQRQMARNEAKEFDKQQDKLNRIMNKVAYQQNTISRKNPHGAKVLKKKMHSLKAQERRLANSSLTEMPDVEEGIHFFFEDVFLPKHRKVLELFLDELKIEGRVLSKNIRLNIYGNEHICIVGKNGVGKSTLLKKIYHILKDRKDVNVGYMPQIYEDVLKQNDSAIDFLVPEKNQDKITVARQYLGNMKFTKDEMVGKIKDLSNGTKAKLFLIKLILEKYDVLILDEPTRNVSPLSNPIIRKVLKEYNGAIISVSHDRKYIDEVASKVYVLTKEGLYER